jgi:DNA-binding MarR family transcriptional regulator
MDRQDQFYQNKLGLDRTTLTRNLSVLELEGFIKISSGKDYRTNVFNTEARKI